MPRPPFRKVVWMRRRRGRRRERYFSNFRIVVQGMVILRREGMVLVRRWVRVRELLRMLLRRVRVREWRRRRTRTTQTA